MHYADSPSRAACGAKATSSNSTTNWAKVTCSGCVNADRRSWN